MNPTRLAVTDPPPLASTTHVAVSGDGPLTHVREHPETDSADIDRIERLLKRPALILDGGAGRGGFVALARARGHHAWALDTEAAAARIWARRGVPGLLADAFSPPFRRGSFDIVRIKDILEHVAEPLRMVEACRELLRPDGFLFIHIPSPYSQLYPIGNFWDDYTHVRPFSRLGVRRLVEDAGLEVVKIEAYTAGRNPVERALNRVLALILPYEYRVICRRPAPL